VIDTDGGITYLRPRGWSGRGHAVTLGDVSGGLATSTRVSGPIQ
jgi:hypothetical protein